MTIGNDDSVHVRTGFIRTLSCLLSLYMFLAMPATAADWNLSSLLEGFARISSAKAQYTETRSSGFVDVPMVEHGSLSYVAPDYIAKRSVHGKSGYIVRGDVAEILGSNPARQLHLDNYPPLAAMIAALRATLSGNAKVLHHYFNIRLSGNATDWRLQLTPRKPSLDQAISSITIHGMTNRILRVEIRQNDGDHSELTLHDQVIRERQPSTP